MKEEKMLRILVALDGTPRAETILAAIMPLVRTVRVDLLLLRVVEGPGEVEAAKAYLSRLEGALALHRIRAESVVDIGVPAPAILSRLKDGGFDYAAMTTHGRRGVDRLLMGSVAESVVRSAGLPLIVNRPDARIGDWKRIVVPLDGSPEAEEILGGVEPLARMTGATLHLVNVSEVLVSSPGIEFGYAAVTVPDMKPYLARMKERLVRRGLEVVTESRIGFPGAEVVQYAGETGAGLIAVTTHGRRGLRRAIMGSVAEQILRTSPCAVLVRPLETAGAGGVTATPPQALEAIPGRADGAEKS